MSKDIVAVRALIVSPWILGRHVKAALGRSDVVLKQRRATRMLPSSDGASFQRPARGADHQTQVRETANLWAWEARSAWFGTSTDHDL